MLNSTILVYTHKYATERIKNEIEAKHEKTPGIT